jgi:hypothetical protein
MLADEGRVHEWAWRSVAVEPVNREMNMNLAKYRDTFMALTGLGTLFVCILACTSFSPDDKQILYPTYDPKTRSLGVAVYDRAAQKSKVLLVSKVVPEPGGKVQPVMMRPQWLADGKNVVVAWMLPQDSKDDGTALTLALLSVEGKEPVRLLHLAALRDPSSVISYPLAVTGTRAMFNSGSNLITLDLVTGEARTQTNRYPLMVFASPVPGRFGYMEQDEEEKVECGLLNPETMVREWRIQMDKEEGEKGFIGFSPVGRKAAFTPGKDGEPIIQLYEEGQPSKPVKVPAAEGEHIGLGQVEFARDGRSLFVVFESKVDDKTGPSLGIMELPLDGRPPKRTVLISGAGFDAKESVSAFQFGLSHDGKALAISSAYLALFHDSFRAEDCALFIVDLASDKRPVTKIPIPLPVGAGKFDK